MAYLIVGIGVGKTCQVASYYAATQMRTRLCEVLDQNPESLLPGDRKRRYDPSVRKLKKDKRDREAAEEEREIADESVSAETKARECNR